LLNFDTATVAQTGSLLCRRLATGETPPPRISAGCQSEAPSWI
jgi:hypothetical protein